MKGNSFLLDLKRNLIYAGMQIILLSPKMIIPAIEDS